LAVFTRRVEQRAALTGFFTGVAGISYIALWTSLYWPWYAGVGAAITFVSGLVASYLVVESTNQKVKL
jgi:hypothetical protein